MQGSSISKQALTTLIKERVLYCIHYHRSLDVAASMREEVALLTSLVTGSPTADAQVWQSQMLLVFQLLLPATGLFGSFNISKSPLQIVSSASKFRLTPVCLSLTAKKQTQSTPSAVCNDVFVEAQKPPANKGCSSLPACTGFSLGSWHGQPEKKSCIVSQHAQTDLTPAWILPKAVDVLLSVLESLDDHSSW